MNIGKVYLVGAGPGDPGLVTLKAAHCLKIADVVVYDQLVHPDILQLAGKKAALIFGGKYPQNHVLFQNEINSLLVKQARQGKTVVRLKGGDPLLFGRGAEEALELVKARIPFEIVPGVSSAYSVPAYAGIPVTYRNISSRLNIVTGHETPDKGAATIPWKKLVDKHSTLVILMGMANLAQIIQQITKDPATLKMPIAVINNGTRRDQRVVTGTLANIVTRVQQEGIKSPAIIVIGEVVGLRDKLQWFKPEPLLHGKRILVTRPEHQAAEISALLKGHGAYVTAIPLIEIVPAPDTLKIRSTLKNIKVYDWVIFTSVNGVDLFLKAMSRNKLPRSHLRNIKFAAIGRKTADILVKAGLKVALIPKDFVQESLADELIRKVSQDARLLLVHAEGSRPVLEQKLLSAGFTIDTVGIYKSLPVLKNHARIRMMLARKQLDAVLLTSSSCVDSFADIFARRQLKAKTKGVVIGLIGPISAATARQVGLPVTVESREFTVQGLTNALIDHYKVVNP
ncbi:MAG: uroporphyrinogen-III C-methyltransferase [Candidatus Omnitrophica bacterium]|nr:uroporphyrinogen-III C-methyltransferase [Candidatus Omnitrophota bacterium]